MLNFNLPLQTANLVSNSFKKEKLLAKTAYISRIAVGQVLEVSYYLPAKDGLKIRSFVGVCLSTAKRGVNSSFLLRNSYRSNSLEVRFFIYSPLVLRVNFLYWYRRKSRLSKLYYIRNLKQKSFQR